jgi:hypothetical protein
MHISTILTLAFVSLGSALAVPASNVTTRNIAPRECYMHGVYWGASRETAAILAQQACNDLFSDREYHRNEASSGCYTLDDRRSVMFMVKLMTSPIRMLGYDECFDGLSKEVYGCDKGGISSYANWVYQYVCSNARVYSGNTNLSRADPNDGSCT